VTLAQNGAADAAIEQFEIILRNLPKSAGSHYYLARTLEGKGEHDEAVAHLREAARLAPTQPVIAAAMKQVEAGVTGVSAYSDL